MSFVPFGRVQARVDVVNLVSKQVSEEPSLGRVCVDRQVEARQVLDAGNGFGKIAQTVTGCCRYHAILPCGPLQPSLVMLFNSSR